MKKCLICILIMFSLLSGCAEKEEALFTLNGNETLVRVEYYVTNPMTRGDDFSIDVTPEKVCSAHIFAERNSEYLSVEDTAITEAQWKEINDAVLAIVPLLKAETAPKKSDNGAGQPYILDGNSSSSFHLTWKADDGEERVQFEIPSDRRFFTLVEILHETADPVGREIVYYDAPVLTGIYFRRESLLPFNEFSYQCTLKKDSSDERYLFATYYEGEPIHISETVYTDTWKTIEEKCGELGIEKFETAGEGKNTLCTLYYSDLTQRKVAPDRQTAQELKTLFEQIIAEQKEKTQ